MLTLISIWVEWQLSDVINQYGDTKMNIFINDLYDIYVKNKSERTLSFSRCSGDEKMSIAKSYFIHQKYTYLDMLDCLEKSDHVSKFFQSVMCCNHLDLPDDSDEEIDVKFINFVCDYFSFSPNIFQDHIIKFITRKSDDMFLSFEGEVSPINEREELVGYLNNDSDIYSNQSDWRL